MKAFRLVKCQPVKIDAAYIKRMMYTRPASEIDERIASIPDANLRRKAKQIQRLEYVGE